MYQRGSRAAMRRDRSAEKRSQHTHGDGDEAQPGADLGAPHGARDQNTGTKAAAA
jgi:hypothetical protein